MDRSEICDRFLDQLEFDLYPFQEEALLAWFESEGGGILVTAPTGMGKTLIAEAAIFEALHSQKRVYYTTPLIALTDQKFREFQDLAEKWGFERESIGLVTGNRRVNPDAIVRVVVAEILLNHLLAGDESLTATCAVVMDEFHYFNDYDRGIVWELSLVLLPENVQLLLLSATVGNAPAFIHWMRESHGRQLRLVQSNERRVPLEFIWVPDQLPTELVPKMVSGDDAENRSPALVFCFIRDECWDVAERLKGMPLITSAAKAEIEKELSAADLADGVGPKLRQMLIRGVGVHHAGVLPKHKEVVERLFLRKLVPFVVCTETLAAGINLPARSVVITSLMKGPKRDKKLIPPSSAHQMFGRAGRPQFDTQGYVYSLAHDDDVKIEKWKRKYEQLDPKSKDPGIMRARKTLERKRPTRRKNFRYWAEGQFRTLIEAGPANLASRSMIPYQVLVYLLIKHETLHEAREFLSKRFNTPERIEGFQKQLDYMIGNMSAFGFLTRDADGDHVTVHDSIQELVDFRSVDPLYGSFLTKQLSRGSLEEKLQVLESVLSTPPALERKVQADEFRDPGPLQTESLLPELLKAGLLLLDDDGIPFKPNDDEYVDYTDQPSRQPLITLPVMLKILFDSKLASPEDVQVQPKWIAGGIMEHGDDFYKFTKSRELNKNEGLMLRHLLRLVILCGEFHAHSEEDPDYSTIADRVTQICTQVDRRYTDHFLAQQQESTPVVKI
jgi:superfamily II DNA/RNA helicase